MVIMAIGEFLVRGGVVEMKIEEMIVVIFGGL